MAPEPIPLRALTTLLNYERLISDPRYTRTSLHSTTIADPTLLPRLQENPFIKNRPSSVKKVTVHTYYNDDTIPETDTDPAARASLIPATCAVHPIANPTTLQLSPSQLSDIFYESRSLNGCYKSITLFQEFFALCPPSQYLSIQIKNEPAVLVKPFPRRILEFKLCGPQQMIIHTIIQKIPENTGETYFTGNENEDVHAILGFPKPGIRNIYQARELDDYFIVDMTCMQWGCHGQFGEPYFLGDGSEWQNSMGKVCESMKERGLGASIIDDSKHTELMRKCAKRVWDRWANRENAGWCDYCGVGGKLSACSGCKGERKVWYCGAEHQKKAWKLHRFVCEKKNTGDAGKK